jgi:hypothetical protein
LQFTINIERDSCTEAYCRTWLNDSVQHPYSPTHPCSQFFHHSNSRSPSTLQWDAARGRRISWGRRISRCRSTGVGRRFGVYRRICRFGNNSRNIE